MNITRARPYYNTLVVGKQLQITIASNGQALVEGFVNNVKMMSQTVVANTTFGPFMNNVGLRVSNLTGLVDVEESLSLIAYNPASILQTGGSISNVAITAGSINNTPIGATTPAAVKTSNLAATFTDSSATAGNVTNNSPRGRAAFAAAGTSVVVTNSLVAVASTVLVSLDGADATLTSLRTLPAAGSFTVTGNAAATGITRFDFFVIN